MTWTAFTFCLQIAMSYDWQETVDAGIEQEGSNLSGVSGRCSWDEETDRESMYGGYGGSSHYSEEDKENRLNRRSSTDSNECGPHVSHSGTGLKE